MRALRPYTPPTAEVVYTGITATTDIISKDSLSTAAPDSGISGLEKPGIGEGPAPEEAKQVWGCHWDLWGDEEEEY